jgi:bifunctional non-homologous end joining protein LigD
MLATLVHRPFHRRGWVYEEKYDGFSNIARAVSVLPGRTLLLDGEVVAFDRHVVSHFQLVQTRGSESKYTVFDCLYRDGQDLRDEPLVRRREALTGAIGKAPDKGYFSLRPAF